MKIAFEIKTEPTLRIVGCAGDCGKVKLLDKKERVFDFSSEPRCMVPSYGMDIITAITSTIVPTQTFSINGMKAALGLCRNGLFLSSGHPSMDLMEEHQFVV
jgi:hypothetical protein